MKVREELQKECQLQRCLIACDIQIPDTKSWSTERETWRWFTEKQSFSSRTGGSPKCELSTQKDESLQNRWGLSRISWVKKAWGFWIRLLSLTQGTVIEVQQASYKALLRVSGKSQSCWAAEGFLSICPHRRCPLSPRSSAAHPAPNTLASFKNRAGGHICQVPLLTSSLFSGSSCAGIIEHSSMCVW